MSTDEQPGWLRHYAGGVHRGAEWRVHQGIESAHHAVVFVPAFTGSTGSVIPRRYYSSQHWLLVRKGETHDHDPARRELHRGRTPARGVLSDWRSDVRAADEALLAANRARMDRAFAPAAAAPDLVATGKVEWMPAPMPADFVPIGLPEPPAREWTPVTHPGWMGEIGRAFRERFAYSERLRTLTPLGFWEDGIQYASDQLPAGMRLGLIELDGQVVGEIARLSDGTEAHAFTDRDLKLFLAVSQRIGLDPFARPPYTVRWLIGSER